MTRTAVLVLSVISALLMTSSAAGQVPGQDSVTGSATTGSGRGFTAFTFDVRSGPSGENPTGTVVFDTFFGRIGPLDAVCLNPTKVFNPTVFGDVTVVDAPPLPTSKEQCKNGGWRHFPAFRNQGDCVSFVVP